jgi:3-methyladenine DNA glycosylase AlkD
MRTARHVATLPHMSRDAEGPGTADPAAREPSSRDARAVVEAIDELADESVAAFLQGFFKTAEGEYGEGDQFVGVRVPALRSIAKRFADLDLPELGLLLDSPTHEHRLIALLILVLQWKRGDGPRSEPGERERLHRFYVDAVRGGRVDNWDLVDTSAEHLIGAYLVDRPRDLLFDLARSPSQWQRRAAMLATFSLIKRGDPASTLQLAELLLDDPEPLMHQAVGWMLREVGKRVDRGALTGFLDAHAGRMPRTMLSYATEHLSPEERAAYRAIPREPRSSLS